MDYRIVEKPSFKVVGKTVRVAAKDGENFRRIPQFWEQSRRDGILDRLAELAAPRIIADAAILGLCMDFTPNMEEFTYMIAVEASGNSVPEALVEKSIPGATWAVFEAMGSMPKAIQDVWGGIMSEFFPSEPFEHAAAPDLEIYPRGDVTQPDYRSEVWVPVVKKVTPNLKHGDKIP